jgi:hypothetical protein
MFGLVLFIVYTSTPLGLMARVMGPPTMNWTQQTLDQTLQPLYKTIWRGPGFVHYQDERVQRDHE